MTRSEKARANGLMTVAWVVSLLMFVVGLRGIIEIFDHPSQSLTITSCTLESYGNIPERVLNSDRWPEGPRQGECEIPFSAGDNGQGISTSDTIKTVRQACLKGDDMRVYEVSVSWVSVNTNDSFEVARVPVAYLPGCDQPVINEWAVPPPLINLLRRDARDGNIFVDEWKIVGTAVPFDLESNETFSWDLTKRFSLTLDS